MKNFINNPEKITAELLEGLALAHADLISVEQGNLVVSKKLAQAKRVTVVAFGGTGHEPYVSGLVGEGMADIAVIGDVFATPGPAACIEANKLAEKGCGVLLLVNNHVGDVLTANLVMKQAELLGLNVAKVMVQAEDCEQEAFLNCVPLLKIAGAAAAAGKSLAEVAELVQNFAQNMASANIPDLAPAHVENLLESLNLQDDDKLLVIVNGMGAVSLTQQLVAFRNWHALLTEKDLKIAASYVGNLFTVPEVEALQLLIARMDEELLAYWNAPCRTPYYKN